MIKKFTALIVLIILFILGMNQLFLTKAAGTFANGDIVDAKNLTTNESTYHDPVTASGGQRIRMRLRVVNQGTDPATNTIVKFNLSNAQAPTGTVSADSVTAQTDFVNLNPGGASINFVAGSGKKYGPGCTSGCTIADTITSSGVNIGTVDIGANEVNSFQITIEADIVGTPVNQKPQFKSGNIFDGGVNGVLWVDPINANPGQVVEFRITVINEGNANANDSFVRVELPTTTALTMTPKAFVSGGGADTVSDIATVNVSGTTAQRLVYLPGHAFKFGPGCVNGCQLPETITGQGVNIGNVEPGGTKSFQVTFKTYMSNEAPAPTSRCVVLTANPISGNSPLTVNFTGQGEDTGGNIQEYEFDFGDSSNGQQQVVKTTSKSSSHTYNNNGTFTAKLKVRDSRNNWIGGGDCSRTITVSAPPVNPTSRCVVLTASTSEGTIPLSVTFTGQGEDTGGSIQEYEYDFGDDSGGQPRVVKTNSNQRTHTYNNAGTFKATLKVRDSRNNWLTSSDCERTITAKSQPTVLAAVAPKALPKTGSEAALIIPVLGGVGYYIYRRFKLL